MRREWESHFELLGDDPHVGLALQRRAFRSCLRDGDKINLIRQAEHRSSVSSPFPIQVIGFIARGTQRLNCSLCGSIGRAKNKSAVGCRVL